MPTQGARHHGGALSGQRRTLAGSNPLGEYVRYGAGADRRRGAGPGLAGLPGATRTPDTQFRKLLLYPSELQGERRGHTRVSYPIMPQPDTPCTTITAFNILCRRESRTQDILLSRDNWRNMSCFPRCWGQLPEPMAARVRAGPGCGGCRPLRSQHRVTKLTPRRDLSGSAGWRPASSRSSRAATPPFDRLRVNGAGGSPRRRPSTGSG